MRFENIGFPGWFLRTGPPRSAAEQLHTSCSHSVWLWFSDLSFLSLMPSVQGFHQNCNCPGAYGGKTPLRSGPHCARGRARVRARGWVDGWEGLCVAALFGNWNILQWGWPDSVDRSRGTGEESAGRSLRGWNSSRKSAYATDMYGTPPMCVKRPFV